MESINTLTDVQSTDDEISMKKLDENDERKVQGAVDIVDHYAPKCDNRSDSTQPTCAIDEYTMDSHVLARKPSESLESPIKPFRKVSQSSTSRKFSTSSDTSVNRTPKKVSFSDELPMTSNDNIDDPTKNEQLDASEAQFKSLLTSHSALQENLTETEQEMTVNYSENITDSSKTPSISTQTENALTKADMFPNSRKVSLHSERSFDIDIPASHQKPRRESATTQITTETETAMSTFIENERKMSTGSVKRKSKPNIFFII